MKAKLAKTIAAVALLLTGVATTGCMFFFSDEPKALNSMMD